MHSASQQNLWNHDYDYPDESGSRRLLISVAFSMSLGVWPRGSAGRFYFLTLLTSRYPIGERARLLMLQEERSLHVYKHTASLMDPKTELLSLFTTTSHLHMRDLHYSTYYHIVCASRFAARSYLTPMPCSPTVQISKKCIYIMLRQFQRRRNPHAKNRDPFQTCSRKILMEGKKMVPKKRNKDGRNRSLVLRNRLDELCSKELANVTLSVCGHVETHPCSPPRYC